MDLSHLFKGKNFITPHIIEYGRVGKYAYELSSGDSIFRRCEATYGVSVVDIKSKTTTDLSEGGFDTLKEANRYIASLKDK